MPDDSDRCAAHVFEDNVLLGCPEKPVGLLPARGMRAQDGMQMRVALCAKHLELAEQGSGATFTVTLSQLPDDA